MLTFPSNPAPNQVWPLPAIPGTPQWQFDGTKWKGFEGGLPEAPMDGLLWGRRSGAWSEVPIPPDIPEDVSVLPIGGRLVRVNANTIRYIPFNGAWIRINGVDYPIPPGGISAGTTGVFVNGTPQNLLGGSLLYVYLFNNNGVPTIDFWDVTLGPHATSATPGNVGTEIRLGDDSRTLVGIVRTGGDGTFWNTQQYRYTRSWLNRPVITLYNWALVTPAPGWGYLPQHSVHMVNWMGESVAVNLVSTWSSTAQPDVSIGATLNGGNLGGMSTALMNIGRFHPLSYTVTWDLLEGFNTIEAQASVSAVDGSGSLALAATLAP